MPAALRVPSGDPVDLLLKFGNDVCIRAFLHGGDP
jgi:hypothetical protein